MSVVPCSETLCTIISTTMFASEIVEKIRAAIPGLSRTSSTVSFACLRSTLTPRTTTSSMLAISFFASVPAASWKLERTSNGTENFFANSTARDCITLEPAPAISSNDDDVIFVQEIMDLSRTDVCDFRFCVRAVGQDACFRAGQGNGATTERVDCHRDQRTGGAFAGGEQKIEFAWGRLRRNFARQLE